MLDNFQRLALLFLLALFTGGCQTLPKDTLTQVSTIDALLAGDYDSHMSCETLLQSGDLGIGTFDRLDGEMIVLDGKIYQVRADGRVYTPPPSEGSPFASVIRFSADTHRPLSGPMDMAGFQKELDIIAPNANIFYAFKLKGFFARMKTRSVPAQMKPYPPLTEVTRNQPVFEMENVWGTLVGFRSPAFVKGINVPGYHLHFLSDDHSRGGHVLDLVLLEGDLEADACRRFTMILPAEDSDFARMDFKKDRSQELEKVEQNKE
jgi:acetolactate decarboxylase